MDELVIATGNPHKVAELRAILGGLGARVLGLRDLEAMGEGPFVEPIETGVTFEENAKIKALSYSEQTGRVCLADDSGLEIDALGGMPGVISSHFCTDGRECGMPREERDRLNNERVLREMEGVASEARGARFVCVMVLAGWMESSRTARAGDSPSSVLALARGDFEGRIGLAGEVPRGEFGFGYDPIFLVGPEHARTSAEMTPLEKNAVSHRARAGAAFVRALRARRAGAP